MLHVKDLGSSLREIVTPPGAAGPGARVADRAAAPAPGAPAAPSSPQRQSPQPAREAERDGRFAVPGADDPGSPPPRRGREADRSDTAPDEAQPRPRDRDQDQDRTAERRADLAIDSGVAADLRLQTVFKTAGFAAQRLAQDPQAAASDDAATRTQAARTALRAADSGEAGAADGAEEGRGGISTLLRRTALAVYDFVRSAITGGGRGLGRGGEEGPVVIGGGSPEGVDLQA